MPWAFVVVLAVMAAVRVWNRVGPGWAQPFTGPVAAVALVLVGGVAGLSWEELGLDLSRGGWFAAAAVGSVVVAYGVGLLIPVTRRAFHDPRYREPLRSAALTALVSVPLVTVLVEEVAFRGVLWGLIARVGGPVWASGVTALLFGLWHLGSRADAARGRPVLLPVVFTTLAGVVFAALRYWGGGLLAPIALHWAVNGLGVIAAAWTWRNDLPQPPPLTASPPHP